MGLIGRWIDSLAPEQRDDIITHPDPTCTGELWYGSHGYDDCGCLVGRVVWGTMERAGWDYAREFEPTPTLLCHLGLISKAEFWCWDQAGRRFPRLVKRIGPERAWALIKARAAEGHRPELEPEPDPTRESVRAAT